MKKINLLGYLTMALVFMFTSCSSEEQSILDLKSETTTVEESTFETAFGTNKTTGADTFCFLDEGFNRWGWTNGPFNEEITTLDLMAAAGQCDLEKGEFAGRVSVTKKADNSAIVRFYKLNTSPFVFHETHLYIGSEKFPLTKKGKETVAPGQFPYKHTGLGGLTIDTYRLDFIPDNFYIIAHAVVSK